MAPENTPSPDWLSLVGAILISIMSGYISIAQRIVRGHQASLLWVSSEYTAAIMCGWIAYDAYPTATQYLPGQITMFMFVATAAHFGGRSFQGIENLLYRRYGVDLDGSRKTPRK